MNDSWPISTRPKNIGILAIEIYFPHRYISQSDLEQYDKVSKGKYTIGLGQTNMAFAGDREDIISMSMNSVQLLMNKYKIPYSSIGRLEVGTETIIDKSKSIKSFLMSLFQEHGNTSIEGVDTMNACYGGTNALFNSVHWIESSYWDGRYALVVTGDIAVYSAGPARPTGGAGVVAMLIGPDAPIPMDPHLRGVHMENVYDFYKPNLLSEYPIVDGKLSIDCFIRALDISYRNYKQQFLKIHPTQKFSISQNVDYVLFHTPYNRLAQKAFGRLIYNDFLETNQDSIPNYKDFEKFRTLGLGKGSFSNNDLDKISLEISKKDYIAKVLPSTLLSKELGNTYCASTYAGLLSLICTQSQLLHGKKILVFSYGSGLASSIFSFTVNNTSSSSLLTTTESIAKLCNINERLKNRIQSDPSTFIKALDSRERLMNSKSQSYIPIDDFEHLQPNTFYLEKIDERYIRYYKLKSNFTSKL